ncbi:MAG: anhydro-N-acetylmuramic acid kinase, partial [Burkholderiaceae bacterium]|nr:anhydro-N-acetylmuramic acid kinase [Burkholderiaceae bacterium]
MRELFIGLMSGTSLDGVDAVLADFATTPPRVHGHVHHGFAGELREALLALQRPGADELHRAAVVAQHLARAYAAAVGDLLRHAEVEPAEVRALGVHGQTVRHRPDAGYTIQLNAPATLAELTGIDVVADFRSRDLAAGGQGAPLVPAFHAVLFAAETPRAVINLGGIANLTGLPARGSGEAVIGFDCGPGTVLLDAWAREHLGEPFDRDGRWAAGGCVDEALLQTLLAEPFFAAAPPKSTGRELFDLPWLRAQLARHPPLAPQDVMATLTRLTAAAIGGALAQHFPQAREVVVCGGGAYNATLLRMLAEEVAPRPLFSSAALGVAPEQVEALAFAWLARECLARR